MSLSERSPYIRILPNATTLDIILKNTHFPDELMAPDAPIQCRIEWAENTPVLVFAFKLPSYDLREPLLPGEFQKGDRGWLQQRSIRIRLLLADSVITDRIVERAFVLTGSESEEVQKAFELTNTKTMR